jgi:hypothetical protein
MKLQVKLNRLLEKLVGNSIKMKRSSCRKNCILISESYWLKSKILGKTLELLATPPKPEREIHHPLGCHRPRIPDRIVFEKLTEVLMFGCA